MRVRFTPKSGVSTQTAGEGTHVTGSGAHSPAGSFDMRHLPVALEAVSVALTSPRGMREGGVAAPFDPSRSKKRPFAQLLGKTFSKMK